MKRSQAALAALGIALALSATGWAIGVNSGVFSDGPKHDPVSARHDTSDTAVPEVVETVYVDVTADPPAAPSGSGQVVTAQSGGASESAPSYGEGGQSSEPAAPSGSEDRHDDDHSEGNKQEKRESHDDDDEAEHDDD